MRVLVTGATGYIGGRLVPRLVERGHDVTVWVRQPSACAGREGWEGVAVEKVDLLQPPEDWHKDAMDAKGVQNNKPFDAAYYLVHAMHGGKGFDQRDKQAAEHFAAAMSTNTHVIYLGGLLPDQPSEHLASRAKTGQILADALSGQVTQFQAGPIIGSGSASFEMVRYLTERLPVMLTPKWVTNAVQPIGIRDVLAYLLAAIEPNENGEQTPLGNIEIGADRQTFAELMQGYAAERGLMRRTILPTPFLAPKLAARWVGFVTPIPNRLAIPLVEGVVQPVVADTAQAEKHFPDIQPIPYRQAVAYALQRIEKNLVETRWSDAMTQAELFEFADEEGLMREVRQVRAKASPADVFAACASIGGDRGWPAWQWAWVLRGWLDQLAGGPGLRRGRRDPNTLREGESLDFWRVEKHTPPPPPEGSKAGNAFASGDGSSSINNGGEAGHGLLRLRAEMRLPGKAWLQWETTPENDGTTTLTQTAVFEPKGLFGFLYWYASYPVHLFLFGAMARSLARQAEQAKPNTPPSPSQQTAQ